MSLDIPALRAETPGCAEVLHFNNAGAALIADPVARAVDDHLALERRIGAYEAADRRAGDLAGFYDSLARLLNCAADEIAFVDSATRAWALAFQALALGPGDRILTGRAEYVSNWLAFLLAARRQGVVVDVVPDDAHGEIDVGALEAMIDGRVRLIALTHVPTSGGLVNPAAEVGAVARRHGIVYLLDACQSAGQLPLDVAALGCDLLSGTGRKYLRGPRGTGFLYVRRDLLDRLQPPAIDLASARWTGRDAFEWVPGARRFETWERFVAGQLGLKAAVDTALALGLDAIRARIDHLAETLRGRLAALPGVTVHDQGRVRSGLVTFSRAGETALAVRDRLRAAGINVSVSAAAYARLDLGDRGLDDVVRASVHVYNTEAEIDRFCTVLMADKKG